jgi:ABC-2 type transport system ATP-binding protein
MGDESDASRAETVLARLGGISPEREGTTIRVPSGDGPRALMGVLRELDMEQLFPATLAVREPSLDDVFLRLTGHHAEAEVEEEAEPAPVGGVRR